jgi:peptide deformylase
MSVEMSLLGIVNYPHPTLRRVSRTIKRVDAELRSTVGRMFELMYEANGIGLAANQVDVPLRMFVLNLSGSPEDGEEFVFINPVLSHPKGQAEQEEGCLSLPGLVGNVRRPERIRIEAYDLAGREIRLELDGLFARAAQHEVDHLDGVLFVDKLSETGKMAVREELRELELEFRSQRETGAMPSDEQITGRLTTWENKYC